LYLRTLGLFALRAEARSAQGSARRRSQPFHSVFRSEDAAPFHAACPCSDTVVYRHPPAATGRAGPTDTRCMIQAATGATQLMEAREANLRAME
jgi:hypothetical protein